MSNPLDDLPPPTPAARNALDELPYNGEPIVVSGLPQNKTPAEPKDEGTFLGGVTDPLYRGTAVALGKGVDTVESLINLPVALGGLGAGKLYEVTGGRLGVDPKNLPELPIKPGSSFGGSESIQRGEEYLGLISPDNVNVATSPAGKFLQAGLSAVPQVLMGGGAKSLGEMAAQMTGSFVSGAAANAVEQFGGGVPAQITAGMLAPAATHKGIDAAGEVARKKLTQGADVAGNTKALREAGVQTPSAGLVTGNPSLQRMESTSKKMPGGGFFTKKGNEHVAELEGAVGGQINKLSPGGASPADAGRAIESGLEKFKARFGDRQERLENEADKHMAPDDAVVVDNTKAYLEKAVTLPTGEESLATAVSSPTLQKWHRLLTQDLNKMTSPQGGPGMQPVVAGTTVQKNAVTYETVRKVRTEVGKALDNPTMFPDVPKADLKGLYAALSRDMEAAFNAKGPEAAQAWKRLNDHWSSGSDRKREVFQRVMSKGNMGSPEDIYASAVSGSKDGASRLTRLLNSLPVSERKTVAAAFLDKMGRVAPDAPFSMDKFVTDWGKVHGDAKKALLQGQAAADMDKIVAAAQKIKAANGVLSNQSGSGSAISHVGFAASMTTEILGALIRGRPGEAAGAAAVGASAVGGNALFARAMHDPAFIKWLADGLKTPPDERQLYASRLYNIAKNTKDPDQQEAEAAIALTLGAKGE